MTHRLARPSVPSLRTVERMYQRAEQVGRGLSLRPHLAHIRVRPASHSGDRCDRDRSALGRTRADW